MSTSTQPAWKQSEVFPIIARIIGEEHHLHDRFIVAHEIAARLLQDSDARTIIDTAHQQRQEWTLEHIAANMVAWFSQRFTVGASPYTQAFERTRVDDQWAYRPITAE